MDRKGYGSILSFLCDWITYLCQVFPTRLIEAFIEWLFGSMLSASGVVYQALLHIQYGHK